MLPERSTSTNTVGVFGVQLTMCSWQAPGFEPPEPTRPPAPPIVSIVPPAPDSEPPAVAVPPAVVSLRRSREAVPPPQPSAQISAPATTCDREVVCLRNMVDVGSIGLSTDRP